MKAIDPPAGCEASPGYIVELARGGPWLMLSGSWTPEWADRGVWDTEAAAAEAAENSMSGKEHL